MRVPIYGALLLLTVVVSPARGRVWTDDTGERAEAEFVSLDGEIVNFRLPDGNPRRCELKRLSPADQALVATLTAAASSARALVDEQTATIVQESPEPTLQGATTQSLTSVATSTDTCGPAPQTYECTVMVPEMVTEMRTVTVCEWRAEQRQSTYTTCRMVPETKQFTYEYTVPTYETRTREFVYSVFKPVISTHERDYTVMVPHIEKREGTRRECRMVSVEMTRTVCEDHGSWQQIMRHSGCDCCGSCSWVCNTWVPKYEQREVKYTVMQPQMHEVPYEFNVTVCKPEKRTETMQVCNYVAEQQKHSVPYTVCVPVTKTDTREVTSYRRVEEQKTRTYTVRVPYQVEKEVPVRVCRMVAKKVTMQESVCGPAPCWCGKHCW